MSQAEDEALVLGYNVLGTPLQPCSFAPLTGFARNGHCAFFEADRGRHLICARVTEAFLHFSLRAGNDLTTPRPKWRFPGLKAGDRWCLCVARWLEALQAGVAPPVILEATERAVLEVVPLELLRMFAWQRQEQSIPKGGS